MYIDFTKGENKMHLSNVSNVIDYLKKSGYSEYKNPLAENGMVFSADKRIVEEVKKCGLNNNVVYYKVHVYNMDLSMYGSNLKPYCSVKVEICGEQYGVSFWLTSNLQFSELEEKLQVVEQALLKAWNNL